MAQGSSDLIDLPDNPEVEVSLLRFLKTADEPGFRQAVFRSDEILPLSRALSDPDPVIRNRAAQALSWHKDPRAGLVLAQVYNHFDRRVRECAAERVTRENLEDRIPCLVENKVSKFSKKKAAGPVTSLPDLIDMMKNGVYQDRRTAIHLLVTLHGHRALPALAGALEESEKRPTMEYRPYLTELEVLPAFAEFRDTGSAEVLLLQLQDDRPAFCAAALYLLAALKESRAFSPALRLLEDPSFEVRRGAVTVLGSLADARAVAPLIRVLDDPDPRVVRAAVTMLGEFPGPEVVPALVPFLGVLGISEFAVRALSKMAPVATGPLVAAAGSDDPRVRAGAVEVITLYNDPRCTAVLTAALSDGDPTVVNAALPAFERTATPGSTEALVLLGENRPTGIDTRRLISALVATRDARAAPLLARYIHWMDLTESNMAKRAFEADRIDVRSVEDFEKVIPALERNDDAVVQWMIRTCRKLGQETRPLIRNAVRDPRYAKAAARVLLGLGYKLRDAGDREILEALYGRSRKKEDVEKLQLLESLLPAEPAMPSAADEETVRRLVETFLDRENPGSGRAREELARIGLPAFIPLALALEVRKTSMSDMQRILSVLAMFHDASAVDALTGYLQDPRWGFRAAAAYTLGAIREERAAIALVPLLSDQNVNVRLAAISALGMIDTEQSAQALIPCLKDPGMVLVVKACQALGDLEYPVAIPPLIAVLDHSDAFVRAEAGKALQKLSRQSREPLIREAENPDPRVRAGVITGLQVCTDRRSRDACIRALHDPDVSVREAAAGAFEKVWDPAALDHLVLLWDDPDAQVRYNVASALTHSHDPRGALALARMSRDRDKRIARIGFSSCMQNLGQTATLDDAKRLIMVLADPVFHNDEIAERFVRAGPGIIPDLLAALVDPDENFSYGASFVLVALGYTQCDPVVAGLISLLSRTDAAVRERVKTTLVTIGTPARPLLMEALESDDPLVWQEVVETIRLIEERETAS